MVESTRAQGEEYENNNKEKILWRENIGEACIGSQTEHTRRNTIQGRKLTKHMVWFDTILTN